MKESSKCLGGAANLGCSRLSSRLVGIASPWRSRLESRLQAGLAAPQSGIAATNLTDRNRRFRRMMSGMAPLWGRDAANTEQPPFESIPGGRPCRGCPPIAWMTRASPATASGQRALRRPFVGARSPPDTTALSAPAGPPRVQGVSVAAGCFVPPKPQQLRKHPL